MNTYYDCFETEPVQTPVVNDKKDSPFADSDYVTPFDQNSFGEDAPKTEEKIKSKRKFKTSASRFS